MLEVEFLRYAFVATSPPDFASPRQMQMKCKRFEILSKQIFMRLLRLFLLPFLRLPPAPLGQ
jgi:hypothetical protein